MSTLAVVERVLRENINPMSVRDIVQKAGKELPSKSRTPDTVVARDLSMNIKKFGKTSKFVRTSPGRYAIRELYLNSSKAHSLHDSKMNVTQFNVTPIVGTALDQSRAGVKSLNNERLRPESKSLKLKKK